MSIFRDSFMGACLLGSLLAFAPGRPAHAEAASAGNAVVLAGPEQRVALVIGNSSYQHVAQLPNPANDARSVAQLLNTAGFEVISATDLNHNQMIETIQDFSAKIAERGPNTVAMIYYAGHGVQLAGENYLIPVDAKISSEPDLVNDSVRLVDVMATLETIPSRMRIVILDSCRNNPFPALHDAGRGLAIVDAPNGSIVGYSTAPGTEALDGAGDHSPYTSAFLRLAREKDVPIEQLFKRIRLDVNSATAGQQVPWESSSLTSDFYFFGDTAVAATRPPEQVKTAYVADDLPSRAARQAYDYVLSENSIENYQEYIRLYPHDPHCDRIRALLASLVQAKAWHHAVLANSPVEYKSFYDKYSNSPYAQSALKLQAQPKLFALSQPRQILAPASIKLGGHGFPQNGIGGTVAGKLGAENFGHGGKIATLQAPGHNLFSGHHGTGKVLDLPRSGPHKFGAHQNWKPRGDFVHIGERPTKSFSHHHDFQPSFGKSRSSFDMAPGIGHGFGGHSNGNFHMTSSPFGSGGGFSRW
jgi:Caspase domain